MAEHGQTQPTTVSKPLANYLNMTAPRKRASRLSRSSEQGRRRRPPIDNRGLQLDEGNDSA